MVAHKTGTIGRTTNDVGILYLPSDAGHVVMVAFVKESDDPVPEREKAIAEAARAAHDYFLFVPLRKRSGSAGPAERGDPEEWRVVLR